MRIAMPRESQLSGERPDWSQRIVSAVVVLLAAALLALEINPVTELFLRASPLSERGGLVLRLRPLLSIAGHGLLILIGLHHTRSPYARTRGARSGRLLAYGALALELASLLPCVAMPDALCGLWFILVNPWAALAMLIGGGCIVWAAAGRGLLYCSLAAGAGLGTLLLLAYWTVTPKHADDCGRASVRADACLLEFAVRDRDALLCQRIEHDSTRWTCLYRLAERTRMPELCAHIAPPCRDHTPGLGCEPALYRDTCFVVVSRALGDARYCAAIIDATKRESCKTALDR
jgi:hypothetical protein